MTREERLQADHESLRALQKSSSILEFEAMGEPPDRYLVTFRGRGAYRESRPNAQIEFLDLHQCEIRLPYSYPGRPPDLRWLSRAFHPNISFSGFINFREIGFVWEPEIGLDQVCCRLWDVARLEFINLERATNFAAKNWFQRQQELQLPLDPRPLRDRQYQAVSNIVKYRRKGAKRVEIERESAPSDVLYIGEDSAAPPFTPPRPDDEDVLYIGE